jgi:Ser/Thr protein kinase RdoA (MazF antagonist)
MFEWVDGRQLGSVEEGIGRAAGIAEIYATIGQLAGRLHNQAASWRLPAEFTRHAWDADGLAGGEPLWGQFWKLSAASRSEKRLLTQARDRVHRDLERLCRTPDDYSMIHADFAPENLLVDGNAICLIDFDDAGFGWHLFELATSLFFIRREPFFEMAQEALLKGYREHRTLPDDQLNLLPLFFLARGLTYVGWVHTRPETETAHELTPMLLEEACTLAEQYLST